MCLRRVLLPLRLAPSPTALPLLGHAHLLLLVPTVHRLTEAVAQMGSRLGSLFVLRLGGAAGARLVVSTRAEDARTLHRHEGRLPCRPPLDALAACRRQLFGDDHVGVVPAEGNEWRRLRHHLDALLRPELLQSCRSHHHHVADNFVRHVAGQRDADNTLHDLYSHLTRYAIEGKSVDESA